MTAGAQTWDEAITSLEMAVTDQRAAVAEGRFGETAAFEVPVHQLGPVPAHLRARAEAVLGETLAMEQSLEARIDTMARRTLAARHARAHAPRRAALFIDRSA